MGSAGYGMGALFGVLTGIACTQGLLLGNVMGSIAVRMLGVVLMAVWIVCIAVVGLVHRRY